MSEKKADAGDIVYINGTIPVSRALADELCATLPPPFLPPEPFSYPPFNPTPEQWKRGQQVAALLDKGLNPSDHGFK